jgi:uncharacterized protein
MKRTNFTYLGLLISFFSISLLSLLFKTLSQLNVSIDVIILLREAAIFLCVFLLFWIITKKEEVSLSSIGFNRPARETVLWTFITMLLCLLGALGSLLLLELLGLRLGESVPPIKFSKFAFIVMIIRAGVAEEIFFRGYILERLSSLLRNRWAAGLLSLIPFALMHYTQGIPGILVSFILGGILTLTYFWKRNLMANIISHFMVDFIPNIVLPLVDHP